MASRTKSTVTFAPAKVIQPIFTRGNISLSQDGRVLASCLDEDVLLTDLNTGAELVRIEGVSLCSNLDGVGASDVLTSLCDRMGRSRPV